MYVKIVFLYERMFFYVCEELKAIWSSLTVAINITVLGVFI